MLLYLCFISRSWGDSLNWSYIFNLDGLTARIVLLVIMGETGILEIFDCLSLECEYSWLSSSSFGDQIPRKPPSRQSTKRTSSTHFSESLHSFYYAPWFLLGYNHDTFNKYMGKNVEGPS